MTNDMTIDEHDKIISDKCNFFYKNQNFIHLTLKKGEWLNGQIISIGSNYIEFNDREDGYMILFFSEIRDLELFKNAE